MSWSIDIRWDGHRWAFTDVPVLVTESTTVLAKAQTSYTPRVFSVELPMGNTAKLLAAGHHPVSMYVVISYAGQVISTSPCSAIKAGRAGEMTTLEMSDTLPRDTSTIPGLRDMRVVTINEDQTARNRDIAIARAQAENERRRRYESYGRPDPNGSWIRTYDIVEAAWSTAYDEKAEGKAYPLILGRPGSDGTPAAPAYPIDASAELLLVAGHQCTVGTILITRVQSDGTRSAAGYTVSHTDDLQGRQVAVVDITSGQEVSGLPIGYDSGSTYFASWNGTAEGIPSGGDDIIRYLTGQQTGTRVDFGSVRGLRSALASYRFGGVVTQPTSAWSLLEGNVLPMVPVAMVPTNDGIGFRSLLFGAGPSDIQHHLTAGPGFVLRDRPAIGSRNTVVNLWNVNYSYNLESNGYSKVITAGAGRSDIGDRSRQIHGLAADTRDAPWVYSAATAGLIGRNLVYRSAVDRLALEYQCAPALYGVEGSKPVGVGDIVTIRDADIGLSDAPSMVTSVRRLGSDLRVVLTVFEPGIR